LRGALVTAPLALVCALALSGCGGKTSPRATAASSPGSSGLITGITEFDPSLMAPRPGASALQAQWQRRFAELRPDYLRIVVLWKPVQPTAASQVDLAAPGSGGASALEQLRAARDAGLEPIVTFMATPGWAAQGAGGCTPPNANPDARAPAAAAIPAYEQLVRAVLETAQRERIPIRHVSPWNEPNSGLFLAPQRDTCDPSRPSLSAGEYAPLARAALRAVKAQPGGGDLLLGETSSPFARRGNISLPEEFVAGLPDDVVCAAGVYTHHVYVGDPERLDAIRAALLAHHCPAGAPRFWITETGAGRDGPNNTRSPDPAVERRSCRRLQAQLTSWWRDPNVDVAIQYTFREDPNFPVGLVDGGLTRTYAAYDVWRAWGARPSAASMPPPLPPGCR